jgi:hypothetical protein
MANGDTDRFDNKEVLVRIITLDSNENTNSKYDLIEQISTATNQQTAVTDADRASNDKIQFVNAEEKVHRRVGVKMHHGAASQGHVERHVSI